MNQAGDWVEELWRELGPEAVARVCKLTHAVTLLADAPGAPAADAVEHAVSEAHQLSGSLGSFGLMTASEVARRLEQLLQSSQFKRAADTAHELTGLVAGSTLEDSQYDANG